MKTHILLSSLLFSAVSSAAVTVNFTNQGGVYDGLTTANVALFDPVSSTNFTMTVTSSGANLNSNSTGLGISDANIDSGETLFISFDVDTLLSSLDFGGIGGDATDGARVTVGAMVPVELFTGVADFNGTTDVWTPSTSLSLLAGQQIAITATSGTAIFDMDGLEVSAVPEPSSSLLLGMAGVVLVSRRKRAAS